MKRLGWVGWVAVPMFVAGCGGTLTVRTAPPPPPPTLTVTVGTAPPPPPPDAPAPPPAPDAPAPAAPAVDVEVEPIPTGDPEEVQATSEPPDPVYEEQTDSPNPGWVWVGGYWGWNGSDWGWNWGHWIEPVAGQFYIAPYYERVGDRVVYVHGYWGPHDAPHRAYGGDRIVFTAAVRPANYHRGEHVVVEHRAGPAPGKRPGAVYVHATGTVRPLPKQTAPAHRAVAESHTTTGPRGGTTTHETTHETVNKEATGPHGGSVHETTHETTNETVHKGPGGGETVHETTHETTHETVKEPNGSTVTETKHTTTTTTEHVTPAPKGAPVAKGSPAPAPKKK
jgi:hypothetical protein